MEKDINIAIDGPASSGKSTLAKRLAQALQYVYLDTGAMYRTVTKIALDQGVSSTDEEGLEHLLNQLSIEFAVNEEGEQEVWCNGENVTPLIRSKAVNQEVSAYSAVPRVRRHLVEQQRHYAHTHSGIVMDGRDIGTVVLPDAEVKFFLVASAQERAKRRFLENQAKGYSTQTLEELVDDIKRRDQFDSTRKTSPLKAAEDAYQIDSTILSIDEVEQKMLAIIREHLRKES
ncbi:MAG: (d)CMP kinase [Aerococcus sp.]|nr:(d)CMP kinase [Aerococcus sp.]